MRQHIKNIIQENQSFSDKRIRVYRHHKGAVVCSPIFKNFKFYQYVKTNSTHKELRLGRIMWYDE